MGVCESKVNMPGHVAQHSVEQESYASTRQSETKLRAANHNDLIDKAKDVIDAANQKIKNLQIRVMTAQDTNETLQRELVELKSERGETDAVTSQYKEELEVQKETMRRWKAKIKSLKSELMDVEEERDATDVAYKTSLVTIADSLFKVHGDQISKLKFNKMSKKFVIFVNKINHLFYYDENGPKFMKIKHVSVNDSSIQKNMNQSWFLVIGDRRSALFVAESRVIRDKWVDFMKASLGKTSSTPRAIADTVALAEPAPVATSSSLKLPEDMLPAEKAHESCFGQCQSPINIISMDSAANNGATVPLQRDQFAANGLKFSYPEKVSGCTIMNNGHTVQVNIPDSSKCRVQIYGGEYALKQFHFHTPSEHTIDSKQYEMEMHLVHVNEQGKICVLGFIFTLGQRYQQPRLKLTKTRNHLVLAHGKKSRSAARSETEVDGDESDDLETDDEWEDDEEAAALIQNKAKKNGNDFLSQFWDELPTTKTEEDVVLKKDLSFDYLFETSSKSVKKNVKTNEIEIDMDIFEYMGSLTTPPYTEGVQWLVSKTTHFINESQLKSLRVCWNNHSNARPVQKYFGRQVSLRSKSSLRVV